MTRIFILLSAVTVVLACNAQPASEDEMGHTQPLVEQSEEGLPDAASTPLQASTSDEAEPSETETAADDEGSGDAMVIGPAPTVQPYTNTLQHRPNPRLQLDPSFQPRISPNQLRVPPTGATELRLQPASNQ